MIGAYSAALGRFINRDPIAEQGGINLFGYVGNNPISFRDTLGLAVLPSNVAGPVGPGDTRSPVPIAPPDADIAGNLVEAQDHPGDWCWFKSQVQGHGPWDYKQEGASYQDFGNFNYGATAAALGVTLDQALRFAGLAQILAGTSTPAWGNPLGQAPFGDDPADQAQIQAGYNWFGSPDQAAQQPKPRNAPISQCCP